MPQWTPTAAHTRLCRQKFVTSVLAVPTSALETLAVDPQAWGRYDQDMGTGGIFYVHQVLDHWGHTEGTSDISTVGTN